MINELSQVRGITIYELKMHWRRRTFLVITLSMVVLVLAASLLGSSDLGQLESRLITSGAFSEEDAHRIVDFTILYATWPVVWVTMVFILPIMVADVIPLDRQLKVGELLHTLPLTNAIYTWGKLLGVWVAALLCVGMVSLLTAVMWWLQVGPFDVALYLLVGFSGSMVLAILNSGLGVLLASGQPGRRRALMVVIGVLLIFPFFLMRGENDVLNYFNPIRMHIFSDFIASISDIGSNPKATFILFSNEGILTILVGLIQIALIWMIGWGWQRFHEAR
jgi:hypothetical protein